MRRVLLLPLLLFACRTTPDSPDALNRDDEETGERCRGWNGWLCGERELLVAACNVGGEQCELRRTDGRVFPCAPGCVCDEAARAALTECDP